MARWDLKALRGRSSEACERCSFAGECTLAEVKAGDHMVVRSVDDPAARVTALRFGMAEGAPVRCVAKVPAGPVVLRSGRQEIAVGRRLAERIIVSPAEDEG